MHYAIRDRHKEALEAYRIAEQSMLKAAELQYHMGLTLIELGQFADARIAARKASETYSVEHLGTLPFDPRVISLSDEGTPFVVKEPESKAAKDFGIVVQTLKSKIGM